MSVVLNDKPNKVTVDETTNSVSVTSASTSVEISATGPQGAQGLTGPAGAGGADGYYGAFYDTTDQTVFLTTAAYEIAANSTSESDGVAMAVNDAGYKTRMTFTYAGTYNYQYSLQFKNTSSQDAIVNVWLRKNDTDVADSNSQWSVPAKHGGDNGAIIGAVNFVLSVNANDYLTLMWQAESTSVSIDTIPAGTTPTTPVTPGVILTATQVMYTQVGPTGPSGVVAVNAPITNSGTSTSANLSLSVGTGLTTSAGSLVANFGTSASTVAAGDRGLPTGGATNQVLTKSSASDYATSWATPALVLIKSQAVGSGVASVVINDAFPSGYSVFDIHFDNIVGSVTFQSTVNFQLNDVTSAYYGGLWGRNYIPTTQEFRTNNGTACVITRLFNGPGNITRFTINNPNVATSTGWTGTWAEGGEGGFLYGLQISNSIATGFTIIAASGTLTGGTIRVYGLANT